jgi:hypothetical protein
MVNSAWSEIGMAHAMSVDDLESLIVFGCIGVGAFCLFLGLIVAARARPLVLAGSSGSIRPSVPATVILMVGLFFPLVMLPILGHTLISAGLGMVQFGVVGYALLSIPSLPYFFPYYQVDWDEMGVRGPGRFSLIPWRTQRSSLLWPEIAKLQVDKNGTRLTGHDGQRIAWSGIYGGASALSQAIAARRPDLVPTR